MTVRRGLLIAAPLAAAVVVAGTSGALAARPAPTAPRAGAAVGVPAPARVSTVSTVAAARPAALPATFVGSDRTGRVGEFRVRDGRLVRYLSTARQKAVDPRYSRDRAYVYYSENEGCGPVVRVRPGRTAVTQVRTRYAGAPIAVGDGKALASNTCALAGKMTVATGARGRTHYVLGLSVYGATSLSYAPGSQLLALSAHGPGVYVANLTRERVSFNGKIPCPTALRGCETRAGEYGPDGRLWFVASTTGRGAKAYLAYYSRGKSYVTTQLPKASPFAHASAAASGALVISGIASITATRSDYVVSWDGRTLRRHTTAVIAPSW